MMDTRRLRLAVLALGILSLAWMALESPSSPRPLPDPPLPERAGEMRRSRRGVEYRDLEEGQGATARDLDRVAVHFTIWLESGEKLASSRALGQPLVFMLGNEQVVTGIEEAVAGMRVGGRRAAWIPPELGYESFGAPGVPGGSTLVVDLELVGTGLKQEGPYPADRLERRPGTGLDRERFASQKLPPKSGSRVPGHDLTGGFNRVDPKRSPSPAAGTPRSAPR
jgi:hypothetical protein